MSNLEFLSLSFNEISEIEGLETLTNLKVLILKNNRITAIKNLEFLTKLKVLILGDSGGLENKVGYELLNSSLDKYVEDKSELSKFKSNRIKEIKNLEKLTNLEILNLDSNQIHKIRGLEKLKNLKQLFLRNNRITEIKGLENLRNLEVLDISYNRIKVIEGLENKENLVQLNLAFNEIDDIGYIGDEVPILKELKLYGNPGYWRIARPMGGEDFTGVLWKRP